MPEPNDDPQSPDEYPLSPDEPLPQVEDSMPAQPIDSAERPIDAETNQFSLGELLGLVTVIAVLLSMIGSVVRWTSLGKSPATLAAVYATVLGLVAVVSMIALSWLPQARRIAVVGWWALLALYIITAIVAVVVSK